MNQPFLFELPEIDLKQLLINSRNESERVFYGVKEVANLLGLSEFQVYWAIWLYRLDAFLLAGEWRISYLAILEYQENAEIIQEQFLAYTEVMKEREIPYIYRARAIVENSGSIEEAYKIFQTEKVLLSTEMFRNIMSKRIPDFETFRIKEEAPQDWYSIEDLELPLEASIDSWAGILRVSADSLKRDLETKKSVVDHFTIFSFLVEREMLNIGVFEEEKAAEIDYNEEAQLSLF